MNPDDLTTVFRKQANRSLWDKLFLMFLNRILDADDEAVVSEAAESAFKLADVAYKKTTTEWEGD